MQNSIKDELRNVFSGKSEVRFGATIQPIAGYLSLSTPASQETANPKYVKEQETEKLISYVTQNQLWIEVDVSQYVSEGAEQKVYLKNSEYVLNSMIRFIMLHGKTTSIVY